MDPLWRAEAAAGAGVPFSRGPPADVAELLMCPLCPFQHQKRNWREMSGQRGDMEGAATVGVPPVGHVGLWKASKLFRRADCHQETHHQEAVGQELQWELERPPPSGMV